MKNVKFTEFETSLQAALATAIEYAKSFSELAPATTKLICSIKVSTLICLSRAARKFANSPSPKKCVGLAEDACELVRGTDDDRITRNNLAYAYLAADRKKKCKELLTTLLREAKKEKNQTWIADYQSRLASLDDDQERIENFRCDVAEAADAVHGLDSLLVPYTIRPQLR